MRYYENEPGYSNEKQTKLTLEHCNPLGYWIRMALNWNRWANVAVMKIVVYLETIPMASMLD